MRRTYAASIVIVISLFACGDSSEQDDNPIASAPSQAGSSGASGLSAQAGASGRGGAAAAGSSQGGASQQAAGQGGAAGLAGQPAAGGGGGQSGEGGSGGEGGASGQTGASGEGGASATAGSSGEGGGAQTGGSAGASGGAEAGSGGGAGEAGSAGAAGAQGGTPCTTALDCGDAALFICDPTTLTCKPPECNLSDMPCPEGKVCAAQYPGLDVGACYDACEGPGVGACSDGRTCVPLFGARYGYCKQQGQGPKLGELCVPGAVDTGCSEGVCAFLGPSVDTEPRCVQICDLFAQNPCPEGLVCNLRGTCSFAPSDVDEASVGQPCSNTTPLWPCAQDGTTVGGVCANVNGATFCRRMCILGGNDCGDGELCLTNRPEMGVGACFVDPDGACAGGAQQSACATCVGEQTAPGGCCEGAFESCAGDADCQAFVDCALACKRVKACINGCAASHPSAPLGQAAFSCLSGFATPGYGACGLACLGPPVCGALLGPTEPSCCTSCQGQAVCQPNGCFNGYYCDSAQCKCTAPPDEATCASP